MAFFAFSDKTRFRLTAFLLGIALLALAGCGGDPGADLVGEWSQTEGQNPGTKLILRADGTGKLEVPDSMNHQIDAWAVETNRQVKFRVFSDELMGEFVVRGGALELTRVESYEEFNGLYRRISDN
ncbi:MAG: hypothetical protein AAGE01_04430 [Pseudomonadota bacterium]